jgi:RNA polymerase sigma-70 factor (ECF subfamily)
MQMNDATIVQRACCGDETAFVELVELYQSPIYRLCYRMLGESIEAEDAAQETFLRAYRHLDCFDPGRSFRTWLFSIASHYCIDCLRRRRPLALPLEAEAASRSHSLIEAGPGPEGLALLKEDTVEFQSLLARLAPRDRDVIMMHYWGALSYDEIAQATGATTEAIKSRLHRARATLAKMLVERPRAPKSLPVGTRAYA